MSGHPPLKPAPTLAVVCALSCLFGLIVLIKFLAQLIYKGARRMFIGRLYDTRPDELCGSVYGTHQIVRLKNARLKLHCVINGPADRPLMLFLHGFPEFWYFWRHQLTEFRKDYRVVAFDLRGYGESDKPRGISEYLLDKLVEDVDELITELGYERCILVGHDWGSAVSWSYSVLHPDRVQRLIVCSSPHPLAMAENIRTSRSQLRRSWYMFFFQLPLLPELVLSADNMKMLQDILTRPPYGASAGTFSHADINTVKYAFADFATLTATINYYRALMRYVSPKVESALRDKKVGVKTLIIYGTTESIPERRTLEMSRKYVEDLTVRFIEGGTHWIHVEHHRQVNETIRQFLDQHPVTD